MTDLVTDISTGQPSDYWTSKLVSMSEASQRSTNNKIASHVTLASAQGRIKSGYTVRTVREIILNDIRELGQDMARLAIDLHIHGYVQTGTEIIKTCKLALESLFAVNSSALSAYESISVEQVEKLKRDMQVEVASFLGTLIQDMNNSVVGKGVYMANKNTPPNTPHVVAGNNSSVIIGSQGVNVQQGKGNTIAPQNPFLKLLSLVWTWLKTKSGM